MDLSIYIILIVPVLLVALPAAYWLVTRRRRARRPTARADATERTELTGSEQYKKRKPT